MDLPGLSRGWLVAGPAPLSAPSVLIPTTWYRAAFRAREEKMPENPACLGWAIESQSFRLSRFRFRPGPLRGRECEQANVPLRRR